MLAGGSAEFSLTFFTFYSSITKQHTTDNQSKMIFASPQTLTTTSKQRPRNSSRTVDLQRIPKQRKNNSLCQLVAQFMKFKSFYTYIKKQQTNLNYLCQSTEANNNFQTRTPFQKISNQFSSPEEKHLAMLASPQKLTIMGPRYQPGTVNLQLILISSQTNPTLKPKHHHTLQLFVSEHDCVFPEDQSKQQRSTAPCLITEGSLPTTVGDAAGKYKPFEPDQRSVWVENIQSS